MEYTYDVIAKAKWNADDKINDILSPILKDFDTETKKIVNELCESNIFNNEEEKLKLIEKFEDTKNKMDNFKYSKYIKMDYEIDGCFFFVNYHISKVIFADEQRKKIAKSITIEL